MTKYSQYDEQEHILRAFEGRKPGRFLDIGAYHPFEFSNTRALYDIGWSGVLVEPAAGCMVSLIREYGDDPRIVLVQAAVGVTWDFVELHVTDDCVSTACTENFLKWRDRAKFLGVVNVPSISLETIKTQFSGSRDFDFVNIDAEGVSVPLAIYALRAAWRPYCFCVEHDGRQAELYNVGEQLGYRLAYENETNAVYVRRG